MQILWWIFYIAGSLVAILAAVMQIRRQSRPKLLPERYAELNTLLVNDEAIREQLRRGNKIQAIKLYREQTGVGLKEAKAAIEMMEQEMQRARISELAETYKEDDAIAYMLITGNKINAIKLYRQRTGTGLKEAKAAIDRMAAEMKVAEAAKDYQPGQRYVDPDELQRLLEAGKKIQAIKYYRETTGVGLKEAKSAVDALIAQKY